MSSNAKDSDAEIDLEDEGVGLDISAQVSVGNHPERVRAWRAVEWQRKKPVILEHRSMPRLCFARQTRQTANPIG
jgi:hypothetical protein